MNRSRTRCDRQRARRGAATIELALVAPFIFLLIFSSFEFSRMMMVRQSLTNAAREGSRHATLLSTQSTASSKALVLDKLQGVVREAGDDAIVRVNFSHDDVSSLLSGTLITAAVEVDCADVSWLPPLFFGGVQIRGVSAMTRE